MKDKRGKPTRARWERESKASFKRADHKKSKANRLWYLGYAGALAYVAAAMQKESLAKRRARKRKLNSAPVVTK